MVAMRSAERPDAGIRTGLVGATAREVAAAVRAGDVSPQEVVGAHLDRIAELDPELGAFQRTCPSRALAEAEDLGRRDDLGSLPLAGVPIAVKDNTPVRDEPARFGCEATSDAPSAEDHEVVRRLRSAGAVVVGVSRMPELGVWAMCENRFGVARNPWNLDRAPGGSSGGAGVAVASGMVPAAHSTDGLGSIRIPAAACGVFGLKPTQHLIPRRIGRTDGFWMSDHGPLATTVEDAALLLSVMAQRPDLAEVRPLDRPIRVAASWEPAAVGVRVDPAWVRAARATGDLLVREGHSVRRADPPFGPFVAVPAISRFLAGPSVEVEGLDTSGLTRAGRRQVSMGRMVRRLGGPRDGEIRRWRARLERFFRDHDLLVQPALGRPPIAADGWLDRSWLANFWANLPQAVFSGAWNLAGYPAASVPTGTLHPDGTPLSIQLVAPEGGEALILSAARLLEEVRPWPRHAPRYAPSRGDAEARGSG